MSTCANIYALFRTAPSSDRVREIETHLVAILGERPWSRNSWDDDPEKFFTPIDTRLLEFTQQGKMTLGRFERRIVGPLGPIDPTRFYGINYLTRWWSVHSPEGPMHKYGKTMLYLLNQADVEYVWFVPDEFYEAEPMTSVIVEHMMSRAAQLAEDEPT